MSKFLLGILLLALLTGRMLYQYDTNPAEQEKSTSMERSQLWLLPDFIIVLLLIGMIFSNFIDYTIPTAKYKEEKTMLVLVDELNEEIKYSKVKKQFIHEIRETYKDLYEAVQPVPFLKDRRFCVNSLFVECGFELLKSKGEEEEWVRLDSYQGIFDESTVKSNTVFLEGQPGYGKTTVALKFAYDWCNSIATSSLKELDIFILLDLNEVGPITSIYRAIKQCILPKDSPLTEKDVENILRHTQSLAIVIDGCDNYDRQGNTISDLISTIAKEISQCCQVVVTTRSNYWFDEYPELSRIRITGFEDNARRDYIRKAIVGNDDTEIISKLEKCLKKNPILEGLKNVPLVFVLFAHLTYGSEEFRKSESVTSFFRYVLSCFYARKVDAYAMESLATDNLFDFNMVGLEKLAFETLTEGRHQKSWKKGELYHHLGHKMFAACMSYGVLVQENQNNNFDGPIHPAFEHKLFESRVRFYNKLFCEWYAAHYLSSRFRKGYDLDLKKHHIDPFAHAYVYPFLCGIYPKCATKVISYLEDLQGGHDFAFRCILEQTGSLDDIEDNIRQLCDDGVIKGDHEGLLLQRPSLRLLELAAANKNFGNGGGSNVNTVGLAVLEKIKSVNEAFINHPKFLNPKDKGSECFMVPK